MLSLLSQPYPISDSPKRKWYIIFGMGIFVYLFLAFFKPFGLNVFNGYFLHFTLLGYVLTCSIILFLNLLVFPPLFPNIFKEEKWVVWKEIVYNLWIISSVGIGNALYTVWKFRGELTFNTILSFQLITLMVAFLPVVALVLLKQVTLLKKNLAEAQSLNESLNHKKRLDAFKEKQVILSAENPKDNFSVNVSDLLYINSADNYIEIAYLEKEIKKKKLIRSSLKVARNDLRIYTAFYRCHRAWIVNLDRVISITGNSQGYRLTVEFSDVTIPVSRNLNLEIGQRLAK